MHQVGDYVLERELGRGAMGRVFLAWHPHLQHHFAIKFIDGAVSEGQSKRFRRELQLMAAVRHPGIVAIHSCGVYEARPYYVMDYVPGEDLEQRLRREGLSFEESLDLLEAVADALAHIHDRGIVHRDLKPANILIDENGAPRITDFGLGRIAGGDSLTLTGESIGTPLYMSPEQARGAEVDGRSDVCSLGLIMFELLAGRRALGGASTAEVLGRAARGDHDRLEQARPDLAHEYVEVYREATAYRPEARFATATAFADALRAAADDGAGASFTPRIRRRATFLRLALVAAALATIVLLFFLIEGRPTVDQGNLASLNQRIVKLDVETSEADIELLLLMAQKVKQTVAAMPIEGRVSEARGATGATLGALYVRLARHALSRGQLEQARRWIAEASSWRPESSAALGLATAGVAALSARGDLRAALDRIDSALPARPGSSELWSWKALLHVELDQFESARDALERARALGLDTPRLELRVLVGEGKARASLAFAERHGLDLPPNQRELVLSSILESSRALRSPGLVETCLRRLDRHGGCEAQRRGFTARTLRAQLELFKTYVDAIRTGGVDALISKLGSDGFASFDLAMGLAYRADPDARVPDQLRQSARLCAVVLNEGCRDRGRAKLCRRHLGHLSAALPRDAHLLALLMMSHVWYREPKLRATLTRLRQRFESIPEVGPEAACLMIEAVSQQAIRGGRHDDARKDLTSAISEYGADPKRVLVLRRLLARSYRATGDLRAELETLTKIIHDNAFETPVMRRLARLRFLSGQEPQALAMMRLVLTQERPNATTGDFELRCDLLATFHVDSKKLGARSLAFIERLEADAEVRPERRLLIAWALLEAKHDKRALRNLDRLAEASLPGLDESTERLIKALRRSLSGKRKDRPRLIVVRLHAFELLERTSAGKSHGEPR